MACHHGFARSPPISRSVSERRSRLRAAPSVWIAAARRRLWMQRRGALFSGTARSPAPRRAARRSAPTLSPRPSASAAIRGGDASRAEMAKVSHGSRGRGRRDLRPLGRSPGRSRRVRPGTMPRMGRLIPCESCHRHRRAAEAACPFCGARRLAACAGIVAFAALGIGWKEPRVSDARAPDAGPEAHPAPKASAPAGAEDAAATGERREAVGGNVIPLYGAPPGPRRGC